MALTKVKMIFGTRGQESFNPLSDLVLKLDASNEASRVLSSGRMSTWTDLINDVVFTPIESNHAASFDGSLFGGKGGFFFNASTPAAAVSTTVPVELLANRMTLFFVIERMASIQGPLFSNYDVDEALAWFQKFGCLGYGGYPSSLASKRTPLNTPMIWATTFNAGVSTDFVGKSGAINTFTDNRGHPFSGAIGRIGLGKDQSHGTGHFKLGLMMAYNRVFAPSEINNTVDYINDTLGWNISEIEQSHNFVLDGNSLVNTSDQGITDSLPDKIATEMALGEHNFPLTAFGGATMTQLLARAAAKVDTLYNPAKEHNVCFMWEGTNELNQDVKTPAEIMDMYETYYNERKAANFSEVVFGTLCPRTTLNETKRQTLNGLLRDNAASIGYKVADFGADGNGIGSYGDQLGPNYIGDGVHLGTPGHAIATDILKPVLNGILAG